jgi:hypothetical protein
MNEKMAGETTLLATFLSDSSFTKKLKDPKFQQYILAQKDIIKDILENGYELMSELPTFDEVISEVIIEKESELPEIKAAEKKVTPLVKSENSTEELINEITNMFSGLTGYPIEMLEKDLDLEADLGIDTVKQMEILSMLKDKYGSLSEKVILKDSPTIEAIANSLAS